MTRLFFPAALLFTLFMAFFPAFSASAQQAWDLPQLMAALAQAPSHESRFTEKKTVSLLKEPVESNGILLFRRPDHLEKHVLLPKDETIIADGDELTWQDASGRSRSMRLSRNPSLAALAGGIRATLAGDLGALQKVFEVKLDGGQKQWTLTLTPTDAAMQRKISGLRIEGSGSRVDTVEVQEKNGDRSLMTIQHE